MSETEKSETEITPPLRPRRVRNEQIQTSVLQYLRKRHFPDQISEVSQKKEFKWCQSLQEMALKGSMSGESNMENLLSYSSITGDTTACDQQFTRLKHFINDAVEPYKSQLKDLLYPLFVYVFLELLCNGHKTPAHKFYGRHVSLFKDEVEHEEVLENLTKLQNPSDVASNKPVLEFKDRRYAISLTDEALTYLMRHLKSEDNMILLQIFNQHLNVDVITGTSLKIELHQSKTPDHKNPISPPSVPDNKVLHDEVSLGLLQQSIKRVREGPPCVPSICFYTFLNAYQGLCSVNISNQRHLLSASFEDSSLKLWNLTPGLFHSDVTDSDISRVYLSSDYYTEEHSGFRKAKHQETVTLKGHDGTVYKSSFTFDDKYLLSASEDSAVRLWDLEKHVNIVDYRGHNYPVWDMDTSSVGSFFATASHDRTAKLWLTDRVYPLRTFTGHTFDVDCVRFHPNGNYIATGSGDKTIRLWSTQDGKSVRLMQGHRGSVLALAFSPNGQYLASAGDDRRVKIWDLSTGSLYKELKGHTETVHALSFNRESSILASGGLDCCIRIWDVKKGAPDTTTLAEGHTSPDLLGAFQTKSATVSFLRFTQHNVLLASGAI